MDSLKLNWHIHSRSPFNFGFATILLASALFLILVYLLETSFASTNLPSGAILCTFEVLLSTLAAFKISDRMRTQKDADARRGLGLLSFFFGLLAVTDGAYMFLFYILKLPRVTTLAVTLSTFPYSVAFLSCTFAIVLLTHSGRGLYSNWKTSILPLLLSVPILCKLLKFLIPVILTSYEENGINLYLLAKLLNTSTSFLLINTALAVFLRTRDKYWSLFSLGLIFIVLVNWALDTQNLSGTPLTFGFFEFFWAAGILLCMFSITLSKESSFDFTPQKEFSLDSHFRHLLLIIFSVFLLITHFLYPINVNAIRVVTALTAAGCLTAVFLSQFLAEKTVSLVSEFGQAISRDHTNRSAENTFPTLPVLTEFPIELRDQLQAIISAKIAQELTVEHSAAKKRQEIRQEANENLYRLAAQFAHDIRSPVAALDTAVGNLIAEPKDATHLIRTVAARINDIANCLLKENPLHRIEDSHVESTNPQLIWHAIEPIVQEKRLLFRGYSKLKILISGDPEAPQWLAVYQAIEFKRIVSNLIDNSFDALLNANGTIHILLTKSVPDNHKNGDAFLSLSVSDNGVGIPPGLIPKLMNEGATFNKRGGSGLGLYHARKCVEAWGGKIKITSTPGRGTTVVLTLPFANPASKS